jgi:ABC-type branched-subunit amino acid transport system substrate-binding protein
MYKNKKIIILIIISIIVLSYEIYVSFYLKWINFAILYSDPYTNEDINAISTIIENRINRYSETVNSIYRFKLDPIYLSFDNLQNSTYELIKTKYNFIIGPDYTNQINYFMNVNNIIFISPNSSSDFLINHPHVFRLKTPDSIQGKVIAKFLIYKNITKTITLTSDIEWSKNIINKFNEEYSKLDGQIIEDITYDPNSSDFSNVIKKLEIKINSEIDIIDRNKYAIVQIGIFETPSLLNQISKNSIIRNVTWVGSDALTSNLVLPYFQNLTNCFNDLTLYSVSIVSSNSSNFLEIEKEYNNYISGELDFVQSARYDACWLLAKTILNMNSINVKDIIDNLKSISEGYVGITGNCNFNSFGDRVNAYYNIYELRDDIKNKSQQILSYDLQNDIFTIISNNNIK